MSFNPRARILCALCYAMAASSLRSPWGLMAAVPVPLALLLVDRDGSLRPLLSLNAANAAMAALLLLTCPNGGARLAALMTVRLNLISVVLLKMVLPLGAGAVSCAALPEKLSALFFLTMRGVFVLSDRMTSANRAAALRGPELRGLMRWKVFACVVGATLIKASGKSERMALAVRCRGGLGGFSQARPAKWEKRDIALCLLFAANAALMLAL